MAYDLKIVNGTIIDGTGRPRFVGDVAVKDGRIVELGKCGERADRTIDAEAAIVTPGFTDLHTHYDGQVSWDADFAPSCFHGVTTCVMGNCGVGFAPVKERDQERLVRLMEGVEDIPGTALSEGLTWNWETHPEYMDAIDGFPHTIDFCSQVTHDALRVYVMGERAVAGEAATEDEVALMRALTRAAVEAGAAGFSTGRSDNHRSADGYRTPAADASARELAGIAQALDGLGHGVLQAVSDFDMNVDLEHFDREFDVIERMAEAGGGCPMSISLMQRDQAPNQWQQIIARAEAAQLKGTTIHLQVAARAIGVMIGLEATFHPFIGFPSYKQISHLPLEERVRRMRDESFRDKLLTEKSDKVSGDGSSLPPLADVLLSQLDMVALRLFRVGDEPQYEPVLDDCLYNEGQQRGLPTLRVIYDALLESDGKELLYFPLYNYIGFNLDNVRTMLTHPLSLPGLSDGGAHVGTVCDASFPTFLLTHWCRDRAKGKFTLEAMIKKQAFDTARYMGLSDRGSIAVGQKADLNIIDMQQLRLLRPHLVADLPAGGKRLLQNAEGYRATLVNGVAITKDGQLTGERPGRLVRVGHPS